LINQNFDWQKDFANAAEKYREALTLLDQLLLREKPGEPEWLELDARNVPLYLNLAQCFLNLGKFYDAANCADEALKREPDNGKALYRRAKARMHTWDLDMVRSCAAIYSYCFQAEADLKRLAELGTDLALVESTLKQLAEKRQEKKQQEQRAYKAMFQGISGDDKPSGKAAGKN